MTTPQVDLFGNPVDPPGDVASGEGASLTAVPVNDMSLVETTLASIADDTTVLHVDDHGELRQCLNRDGRQYADAVSGDLAAIVTQLLAAQFLTTTRRGSCPGRGGGHAVTVTTTNRGRNAAHRWRAYRRPATWPTTDDAIEGES